MYNKYAGEEGQERWSAFACASRKLLCKYGNWKPCDQPVREKLAYQAFLQGETDEIKVNGKIYFADQVFSKDGYKDQYDVKEDLNEAPEVNEKSSPMTPL
jgi:hypothetical protein